jgi:putative hemolysin
MKSHVTLAAGMLLLLVACSQQSSDPNTDTETAVPEIRSLTAQKTRILYGGGDPAIITCDATGGNLSYVWEVDLGDIIPMNASRSVVSFNGTACCVGEIVITCTVSNSLGSTSQSIVITILEEQMQPEIIALQADKIEIRAGTAETTALVCYAIGGDLVYEWESDCGTLAVDPADPSEATLTASTTCIGDQIVRCTVSNGKGSDGKSLLIRVTE